MSKTATGGRLAYADLLRVTAMLAVIVLHLAGSQLGNVPVGSVEFHVLNAYGGLTHWCVPVFVMLSGMFLLDPKHNLSPPSWCSATFCDWRWLCWCGAPPMPWRPRSGYPV